MVPVLPKSGIVITKAGVSPEEIEEAKQMLEIDAWISWIDGGGMAGYGDKNR